MRGNVNHMQTHMNLRKQYDKMERDQWPTHKEGYFAVEKASNSSHKTGCGPTQYIFSWMLVKAAGNRLNTLWLFCILTCSMTLLSILVKVWNVSVNFCVHINECLLTENIYLVWFTSAEVFYSSAPKFGTFFMSHLVFIIECHIMAPPRDWIAFM